MGKKIIIIGGGPGGYVSAIKAAQLGAEVVLIETGKVGGTCLNVGCIPTKTLLHTGGFYRLARRDGVAGVKITGAELDWQAAQTHKDAVVKKLTGGVNALLRHNGVRVINETAALLSGQSVKAGSETLSADAVVIATGSVNSTLDFPGNDLPGVLDSTGALTLEKVPDSMLIVGGGVIGTEFAALYSSLGTRITIIEATPNMLPSFDTELTQYLLTSLGESGVNIFTGAKLTGVRQMGGELTASFEMGGKAQSINAEKVLIAVGRKPYTAGLKLEELGVKMTRGAVDTDEQFRTNVPGLYAVGDCNGKIMLAHAAMAQGVAAVEHIMGVRARYNPGVVPSCVYGMPELASVGMTEKQAADSGIEYCVGRFDLSGNGKALISGSGGFVKIIAGKTLGDVIGVHMIGPNVTELIAEAALCMTLEGTVEDIADTIHAHPTVSESVCEAAMSVFGKPVHGL